MATLEQQPSSGEGVRNKIFIGPSFYHYPTLASLPQAPPCRFSLSKEPDFSSRHQSQIVASNLPPAILAAATPPSRSVTSIQASHCPFPRLWLALFTGPPHRLPETLHSFPKYIHLPLQLFVKCCWLVHGFLLGHPSPWLVPGKKSSSSAAGILSLISGLESAWPGAQAQEQASVTNKNARDGRS